MKNKEIIIGLAFNAISDEDVFNLVEKNNKKCVLCGGFKENSRYVCEECYEVNFKLFSEIKKRYDRFVRQKK